jgi:Lhr-like helicase
MSWAGHVVSMGEMRNIYKILVTKPERKSLLRRPRCRWEDNIRMYLREVEWEFVDWIQPAQNSDQCWVLVYTVMNFRVP